MTPTKDNPINSSTAFCVVILQTCYGSHYCFRSPIRCIEQPIKVNGFWSDRYIEFMDEWLWLDSSQKESARIHIVAKEEDIDRLLLEGRLKPIDPLETIDAAFRVIEEMESGAIEFSESRFLDELSIEWQYFTDSASV